VPAVQFKFEPDHERDDIRKRKLPLLGYQDVTKNISRIQEVVSANGADAGIALLIDEGQHFYRKHKNSPHEGSIWEVWESARRDANPVTILLADIPG
jgi:predicted solute-binding protein